MLPALAAFAGGRSRVVMSDVINKKLELAATLGPITPVNIKREKLADAVLKITDGAGAHILFEASGNPKALESVFDPARPGGRVVVIGMPGAPVSMSVEAARIKEISIATILLPLQTTPTLSEPISRSRVRLRAVTSGAGG